MLLQSGVDLLGLSRRFYREIAGPQ